MDSEHCEIVRKTLSCERDVDEQSFASLAVLRERLERLKKLGCAFSSISFSPDVERLVSSKKAVAVC